MKPRRIFALLLIMGLVLPVCKRAPGPEKQIFRFIDHLEEKSVVESPLMEIAGGPEESGKFYPVKSYPVLDMGSGNNPYGIKRKLNIRSADSNILFAPPKSRYVFDVDIPADAILEFGTGIVRDKISEEILKSGEQEEIAGTFTVLLEVDGHKKTIFRKTHTFLKKDQSMVFQTHKIDVSFPREQAILSFVTDATHPNFSFWFNPVLYQKSNSGNNIILISLDTLRADHLGCYGYTRETSPAIDALAEDSALFLNTYSSSPWTLPSHVSLLTSLNGLKHMVHYEDEKMDSSLVTLADLMRQEGLYCSAFTGGGFVNAAFGFSKGFDSYGQSSQGIHQKDGAEWICGSVLNWIDDHKDRNFFLFIHTYQPHNPFSSPPPFNTMFLEEDDEWNEIDLLNHIGGKKGIFKNLDERERENIISLYDGEIRYTDEKLIEPLMRRLKEIGLYDRSTIILTSDHGEEFYDHRGWEHGHTLYDELLKVPLIIKLPGSKFAKKRIPSIVRLIDVMPTILDELGIDGSGLNLDGKSLMPVLREKEVADRTFIAYKADNILDSHVPQKISMNEENIKLILNKKFAAEQLDFFSSPPPELLPVELYDLSESAGEKNNIVDEKSQIASRLVQLINDMYTKIKEQKSEKADIDKELLEQLRALGYLR
jgi:arylsulfatase A-like enzyme